MPIGKTTAHQPSTSPQRWHCLTGFKLKSRRLSEEHQYELSRPLIQYLNDLEQLLNSNDVDDPNKDQLKTLCSHLNLKLNAITISYTSSVISLDEIIKALSLLNRLNNLTKALPPDAHNLFNTNFTKLETELCSKLDEELHHLNSLSEKEPYILNISESLIQINLLKQLNLLKQQNNLFTKLKKLDANLWDMVDNKISVLNTLLSLGSTIAVKNKAGTIVQLGYCKIKMPNPPSKLLTSLTTLMEIIQSDQSEFYINLTNTIKSLRLKIAARALANN